MPESNNLCERKDGLPRSMQYAYLFNHTTIDRPRLLSRSPVETHKKLTMLEAPAGFGKAVLMAQWAEDALAKGFSTSWYKLSASDNSQEKLLIGLSGLFKNQPTSPIKAGTSDISVENFRELSQQITTNHIVFINDLEQLEDSNSIEALNNLIEYGSPSVFFVIAGNRGNIIPVSAYRAHNQLMHIGASSLKFTRDEISAFFRGRLRDEEVDYLDRVTEGWPIALWYEYCRYEDNNHQLNLPDDNDVARLSSDLKEFINEQIFASLKPDLKNILVKMSIFETFTEKQAKFICDVKGVEGVTANHDLSPLFYYSDEKAGFFSFNPLFRQFLRHKLAESDDAEIKLLHHRAADWHESLGVPSESIYHAAQAGDINRMSQLFVSFGGVEIGLRDGIKTLERIVSLFPNEIGESEPQLLLSRVLLYMKDGRLDIGHHFLDRADERINEDNANTSLDYYKSMVVMLMAIYEDKQVSLAEIAHFERNAKQMMSKRFWSQGWFNNLLCMMYYSVGDMAKAKEAALISMEFYSLSEAVYSQIFIHIHLALIDHVVGDIKRSRHELELARKLCYENFAPDAGLTAIVLVLLAEIEYEQGNEEAAQQLISKSLKRLEEHEAWVEVFVRGYITDSYLKFNNGSIEKAFKTLGRGIVIAQRRNLPRLQRIMEIQKLELLTLSGNLDEALSAIKSLSLDQYITEPGKFKLASFQETYRTIHALARYCIKRGLEEKALALLSRITDVQKQFKHNSFYLKSMILRMLALDRLGRHDSADEIFQDIIREFHTQDYLMTFLIEGKQLRSFINGHVKRVTLSSLPNEYVSFVGRLLADRETASSVKTEKNILTFKEYEVLQSLSLGHSNKVIAQSMNLSETTVKFHLKNIFAKLGVQNRMMAVQVARAKDIIP